MHKVVCYFVTARVLESVYSFTVNYCIGSAVSFYVAMYVIVSMS